MSKLKRLAAPVFWPIERKTKKYAVMPSAGPHSRRSCLPLGIVLRDVLGVAENMNEAKEILSKAMVSVNGKTRKTYNFPVGLMDVVSVGSESYRVLVSSHGLYLQEIDASEAGTKLCRVEDKQVVKGKTQLNLHDGTNILSDMKCSTGDVLIVSVPELTVKSVLKLEKDSVILFVAGHNKGKTGKLEKITVTRSPEPNQAIVSIDNRSISIPKKFVFVVGRDKPVISLGA